MEINSEIFKSSTRIKRRKIYQVLQYFALCLALLFSISAFVSKIDKLAITKITVGGNKNVGSDEIVILASKELGGSYFHIYPKNNILIYPKDHIRRELLRSFIRLKEVVVTGSLGQLYIQATERDPVYLWCDNVNKISIERICYYLDDDGFAFAVAPKFSGDVYLNFFGGNKRGGYIGRSILDSGQFNFVVNVVNVLLGILNGQDRKLGSALGVVVNENGDYDLLLDGGNFQWKISFNLPEGVVGMIGPTNRLEGKLAAIFASSYFQRELFDGNNTLEYIDLRFGKKVFYKFSKK